MCRLQIFLVTEAERKHARRRASLVAVAWFVPGRAKVLSASLYNFTGQKYRRCKGVPVV